MRPPPVTAASVYDYSQKDASQSRPSTVESKPMDPTNSTPSPRAGNVTSNSVATTPRIRKPVAGLRPADAAENNAEAENKVSGKSEIQWTGSVEEASKLAREGQRGFVIYFAAANPSTAVEADCSILENETVGV